MVRLKLAWLAKLAWTLIYGGLAAAILGLFVTREEGGGALGATLLTVGAVAVVLGVASIYILSRGPKSSDTREGTDHPKG